MKYTLKTSQEWLKSQKTVLLEIEWGEATFFTFTSTLQKYRCTIKSKKLKEEKSFKGTNYKNLSEEVYDFLKKNKLLPVVKKGVNIYQDTKKKETIVVKQDDFFLEHEDQLDVSFNDYSDGFTNKFIYKIEKKQDILIIHMKDGIKEAPYSKTEIVKSIVEYIKCLVAEKKKGKINNINHNITVLGESFQRQDLNIVESDEEGEADNGFIDKNLSNIFSLCSLEELSVDEKKLRVWVNKILLRETLEMVTFVKITH